MTIHRDQAFTRYIGIDYSGAETPESRIVGLSVCMAGRDGEPEEVEAPLELQPPKWVKRYWTRKGLAQWLAARLEESCVTLEPTGGLASRRSPGESEVTLIGIDHGFSFPIEYFEAHKLPLNWPAFLDDFQRHWPTDERIYVDFVREGMDGNGAARQGSTRWRRLTERRAGAAKSVFHFDVSGSVAKSTHAGLPWLRWLRQQLGDRLHFWPFDGWEIPAGKSALAEVYPSLWRHCHPRGDRTADQHDAYVVTEWMQKADREGSLKRAFDPTLSDDERQRAEIEGWILGVGG